MNSPKSTPGPWNANPEPAVIEHHEGFEINSPNAGLFANPIGTFTTLENARLAAAAPDLYASLKAIIEHEPERYEPGEAQLFARMERASQRIEAGRVALRKARGEQPE
jgi:hypothetical protein